MVKLSIGTADAASAKADLLVVTVPEGSGEPAGALPPRLATTLSRLLAKARFDGKEGKVLAVAAPKGVAADRILFVGLGRTFGRDAVEAARRAAGTGRKKAGEQGARRIAILPPDASEAGVAAAAEGILLGDYSFDRHKSKPDDEAPKPPTLTVTILAPRGTAAAVRRELGRLAAIAEGCKLARDLGNEPSNVLNPERMATVAREIASERAADGVTCKVWGINEIRRAGMGAFLAVNQGSRDEPRFIHLKYKPPGGQRPRRGVPRRVAVVGKGLTFDSGGISLKPAGGMEDMKMDMCGSAAVLGLFRCLPDLGIPQEVHGFIASTDNMPSGSAIKPGDIVRSMSGRTIEVINTDAEGRLTLVDAITQALRTKPDVVIDLATLTGACAVALGAATGIMSNDRELQDALVASSDATGERAWPLPLFADYEPQLQSEFADVKNVGERYGGALTAGLFIQQWVPEGLPWAHLDIAGSAWTGAELPYCPKGATGIGVRTLAHWLGSLGA